LVFTREEVVTYVAAALALACATVTWGFWRQRTLRRRIEELNSGLEQRVAERTAALHTHVTQVEHLNQELEAFSYSVSHDLRAPLRNITGFLELLARRSAGRLDSESTRYLETVTREATRLGTLIDGLLELSRMSRTAMNFERVALDELVAEIQAEMRPAVAGRAIEWRVGALPAMEADRALLRQVVANLLGNAVKFTRHRAPAVIEIGTLAPPAADGRVTIFVRDNGAGFNPKYADKLFGVFQRLHNQRDFEGTGIGLANVKRIIERHGGKVWAEGSVDKGATFYFNLRLLSP
jgi:light-regulated signal transduction histidine kinase (bacteriophytochrome)